ncbi:transcriptional regulator [Actinokineospora pegani]|uniref:transcriptional regulator n=1 Tax=Actinokineospora pegani TaxID=2654637 RepID=UPI0012E9E44D|nr:transcriptional regulator [Actinokineospora pegani]
MTEELPQAPADPMRLTNVRHLADLAAGAARGTIGLPTSKSTHPRPHHVRTPREAGRPSGTSRITTPRRDDLDARYPGLLDGILHAAR